VQDRRQYTVDLYPYSSSRSSSPFIRSNALPFLYHILLNKSSSFLRWICFRTLRREYNAPFYVSWIYIKTLKVAPSKEHKQSQRSTRRELNSRASNSARKKESSVLIQLLNAIYQSPDKTMPTAKLLRKMKMSNQGQDFIRIAEKGGYIVRYRKKSDYGKKRRSSCIMNRLTLAGEGFLLSQCCRG
jgi:hypothetical protein